MRWLPGIALVVIALAIPFVAGCDNKPTTPKDAMTKDRMMTDRIDTTGKGKMEPMAKDGMEKDKMAPEKDKMGK